VEIVSESLAFTDEPTRVRLFRSGVEPAVDDGVSVDGTSTEVLIASADQPRRFDFVVEAPAGATLRLAESGAVGVIDASGTTIAVIDPASATDTRGQPVATHYELGGMTISQVVDHDEDTALPVATYLGVSAGRFIYVRFNRREVKEFAPRGAVIGAAAFMGFLCRLIPIPWLTAACIVSVAVEAGAILHTFTKADAENKCVELKFEWDGSLAGWKRYSCG
jgi:hypothetical protein